MDSIDRFAFNFMQASLIHVDFAIRVEDKIYCWYSLMATGQLALLVGWCKTTHHTEVVRGNQNYHFKHLLLIVIVIQF